MKLSEAIYKGSKIRPQAFGPFFDDEDETLGYTSCALGAAIEATCIKPVEDIAHDFSFGEFGYLYGTFGHDVLETRVVTPVSGKKLSLVNAVIELNDTLHWRRERIAAWLRTLGY